MNIESLSKFYSDFSPIFELASILFSFITMVLSFRIRSKVKNAKSEQRLEMQKEKISGDLEAFFILVEKNNFDKDNCRKLETFLLDIQAGFPTLRKGLTNRYLFFRLFQGLKNKDWRLSRKFVSKLKAKIEGS